MKALRLKQDNTQLSDESELIVGTVSAPPLCAIVIDFTRKTIEGSLHETMHADD